MDVSSRAADFLRAQGRDVERAAFERHFGDVSLDGFLEVLARYQNDDGGWPSPYSSKWRGWATVHSLLVLKEFGRV